MPQPIISPDSLGRARKVNMEQEGLDYASEVSKVHEETLKFLLEGQAARLQEVNAASPDLPPLKELPAPDSDEGQFLRGFTDENGVPNAEFGLFFDMVDAGLMEESGNLTRKGAAFAMSRSDANASDRIEDYIIRDKAGLNKGPKTSLWDDMKAVGGVLGDAISGVYKTVSAPVRVMGDATIAEEIADGILRQQSAMKSAVEGPATMGAGINLTLDRIAGEMAGNERYIYEKKQARDRFVDDLESMKAADLYEVLGAGETVVNMARSGEAAAEAASANPEQAKAEGAAAGVFLDPSNIATMGVAGTTAKAPGLISRMGLKAERALDAAADAERAAMAAQKAKLALSQAKSGADAAFRQARDLRAIGKVEKAQEFADIARGMGERATVLGQRLPEMEATAAARAQFAAKLAQEAGPAQAVTAAVERAKQIGRRVRAAPAQVIGGTLEKIGDGLLKADSTLGPKLAKITGNARGVAALAGIGTGNPILATLGAADRLIAAGPLVRGIGNFSKILGAEGLQARGTIPFFQRVAQHSDATPLMRATANRLDDMTLGGKVFTPIRRVPNAVAGMGAAAPMNVLFEGLAAGGDFGPATIQRGLAESLVFDGGAGMAGALAGGRMQDFRTKQAGDEINFRRVLDPAQKPLYESMGRGARKNMAAYAAANPELRFNLTDKGPSSYDRNSLTATVNVKGADKLRPLVAHEVNHHIAVKGQMEEGIAALLVGDGSSGGLLRSKAGTLDPSFMAAKEAYNRRMLANKLAPLSDREFALEYFNEATVDALMESADTGHLQRAAGRSNLERVVKAAVESVIPKLPILRDLFFRVGGAVKADGRMVEGNGLLAGGIRELPGAKAMVRRMLDEQAGRKPARNASQASKSEPFVKSVKDAPAMAEAMFSIYETDPDGNVILDAKGMPQVITKETDAARAKAGEEARNVIVKEITEASEGVPEKVPDDPVSAEEAATETPEQKSRRVKPVIGKNGKPTTTYQGTHFSPGALKAIKALNPHQRANLRMTNRAARDLTGETFHVIYNPALSTDAMGKKTYEAMGPKSYEIVPFEHKINKEGGIRVLALVVSRMMENIMRMAAKDVGKRLYKGDVLAIQADIEGALNAHRVTGESDSYFKAKYGERWKEYKNFCNAVLGTDTKAQREANTLFDAEEITGQENKVVEAFRIDRINKMTRMKGRAALPFQYEKVKLNHFPNGVPE